MILNENSFAVVYDNDVTVRIIRPDNSILYIINPDEISSIHQIRTDIVVSFPNKSLNLKFKNSSAATIALTFLKQKINQAILNKSIIESSLDDKTRIYKVRISPLNTGINSIEPASSFQFHSPFLPKRNSTIKLYVNGVSVNVTPDSNEGPAFIYDEVNEIIKNFSNIEIGDKLYWNSNNFYPLNDDDVLFLEYLISV